MFKNMLFVIVTMDIVNIVLSSNDANLLAPRRYCGLQHSDEYVRDNQEILLDEFPWIAQLVYGEDKTIRFVGSLINRRYVLTAAHCIRTGYRFAVMTGVRFGDYDVTTDKDCTNHTSFGEECSDPVEEFGIEELIPHPQYNMRTAANDIGLIRLSRDVEYSEYIRPICLPDTNNFDLEDGTTLIVSGWGVTSLLGEHTKIKKKIWAKIFPRDRCLRIYNDSRRIVSLDHFCVEEAINVCLGDTGGPLMLSVNNQWEQVGIVSFGNGCGDSPTIYIKVTNYLDWIKANLRM